MIALIIDVSNDILGIELKTKIQTKLRIPEEGKVLKIVFAQSMVCMTLESSILTPSNTIAAAGIFINDWMASLGQ